LKVIKKDYGGSCSKPLEIWFVKIKVKRSSRRWKKKGQMRWKWQRKRMKKEKRKRAKR
jgi:large subunit ribosomal protein L41e